jgi:hypothetical protein
MGRRSCGCLTGVWTFAVAPGPLLGVVAVGVAPAAAVATEHAFDESLVPRAVLIVEVESLFGVPLAEPKRLALRKSDGGEPGVTRRIVGELENDIDLLEGAEGGLRVEEVHQRNDREVGGSKDDPSTVRDALECDRGDENDAVRMLAMQ